MAEDEDDMLTVTEAARILGIGARNVRRYIGEERLKARRIGNYWVLRRGDVEAFAKQPRPPSVHRTPRTPKTSA